jgi:hypothetical protein
MESRYAQERVCSSCRDRFPSLAANRVRGIIVVVEHFDFDPGLDFDRPACCDEQ